MSQEVQTSTPGSGKASYRSTPEGMPASLWITPSTASGISLTSSPSTMPMNLS